MQMVRPQIGVPREHRPDGAGDEFQVRQEACACGAGARAELRARQGHGCYCMPVVWRLSCSQALHVQERARPPWQQRQGCASEAGDEVGADDLR
eukprot:8802118-Pyramimonas_sp.AAC.1